jgi:hypothetical protein
MNYAFPSRCGWSAAALYLDALASVPELDGGGNHPAVGAISSTSTLPARNFEQKTLKLEFVFQDHRVMTPDEANYPERWQSVPLEQFASPSNPSQLGYPSDSIGKPPGNPPFLKSETNLPARFITRSPNYSPESPCSRV